MTRDALVASAFHYCDCVLARDAGVYEIIHDLMRNTNGGGSKRLRYGENKDKDKEQFSMSCGSSPKDALYLLPLCNNKESDLRNKTSTIQSFIGGIDGDVGGVTVDVDGIRIGDEEHWKNSTVSASDLLTSSIVLQDIDMNTANHSYSIEAFGKDVIALSKSLARVKQAEIMSHSVLPSKYARVYPSPTDAASLRGLLLSMSEHWRALAIRTCASLYRLRGLLRHEQYCMFYDSHNGGGGSLESYSRAQILREAREALYVYAPLAGRLGMHRLKGELENAAFMVLYTRQYHSVMQIYERSGSAIQSVTDYLCESIESVLKHDTWLSPQLERLTVTSRVKKPYSLWRKLLKLRKRSYFTSSTSKHDSAMSLLNDPNSLTITLVQDAIAVRVIVKAKRLCDDEKEEDIQSREEFLCYYAQNRLMHIWPVINRNRIKDYITNPKPNGYQSLHHTSQCFRYGHYWPFEVQIRTEEMHTKSEYGVAAHWDYKLKGFAKAKGGSNLSLLKGMEIEADNNLTDTGPKDISMLKSKGLTLPADMVGSGLGEKAIIGSLTRSSTLQSYISALSSARQHLLGKSVFVFYLTKDSEMEGKVIG
jgi:ppGpp synthetase/RelA/SpoT-type nucleotidyltranferase